MVKIGKSLKVNKTGEKTPARILARGWAKNTRNISTRVNIRAGVCGGYIEVFRLFKAPRETPRETPREIAEHAPHTPTPFRGWACGDAGH